MQREAHHKVEDSLSVLPIEGLLLAKQRQDSALQLLRRLLQL
jgi:hypothetical protein